MNVRTARWLLIMIFMLVAAVGCSPAATPSSPATPPAATPSSRATPRAPASRPRIDYVALEAEIEKAITIGPVTLDNVRAVLVNVDGESKIAHYRHGFTEEDHGHVFSITKSVLSILIGIAVADGLIADIDQPLSALLPKHREAMSGDTAKVTLRHLMTMSGGFNNQFPGGFVWEEYAKPGRSFVNVLLERREEFEPGRVFWYSDVSAHLVAAVLAAALERADGDRPRTVLDYAREKLFDPLGSSTRPTFSQTLPDLFATEFVTAGFGWGTDPNGIQLGGYGLRLTAPDMMKIGELYRRDGSLERPADRVVSVDPPVHLTVDIQNQNRRPIRRRIRPALVDHQEAQAGWLLRSWARRATHRRAPEIASGNCLPVTRATGQPDRRFRTPQQRVYLRFPPVMTGHCAPSETQPGPECRRCVEQRILKSAGGT
jgi:CubicO group peptidase (beta-lactamase class C family)